jgi:hypothetical protein
VVLILERREKAMSKNFDSAIEVGFCGAVAEPEGLRPVEIIGNHWIYRHKSDGEAKFYRRDEVDAQIAELAAKLKEVAESLNLARLLMDKESRDYVGEIVEGARLLVARVGR